MALFKHTKVAVLASLAAGIAVTLASGPLRAERDVNTELRAQVDALAHSNERLADRLAEQQTELADALVQLAALRAAAGTDAGKPASKPGPPQAQTAAQALAEERAAFRAKALEALKPELAAIQVQLGETVTKTVYDKHTHGYKSPPIGGWARMNVIALNPDNLLPYMPADKIGQASADRTTDRPQ